MAYTINLTDGAVFATIADGTINTSSSMTLVGKNYAGYGQFLDDNFIHLLENASNTTAPPSPLNGQLWWNKTTKVMNVYNGTGWKGLAFSQASASPPNVGNNQIGDLWWDTVNAQLKIWVSNIIGWFVVGPAYSSAQGQSGAIPLSIVDTLSVTYIVTGLYSNNSLVAIVNPNVDFVPADVLYSAPFPKIYKGLTVWTTGRNAGNVVNTGNVYITAGGGANAVANATITVTTTGANVTGYMTSSGNATVGNLITVGTITSTGNITGGNINATASMIAVGSVVGASVTTAEILHSGSNGVGNIGSSSNYFNRLFATATTALYADVAERFAADSVYDAGTVVELGGSEEITKSQQDLSENVFGVISTQAAYLMNGGAGNNETHPPVAMTGRVPVQVIGQVCKGDRLVSAGNGQARSAKPGEATAFNVIGRSLVDKPTIESGIVEAIVTIK
jgi:hypothetical protein